MINNVSAEEDIKENEQEIISEHILEGSESVKFEESVQAAGQSFEEELSEVADDEQHIEITDQSNFDDTAETLGENMHLEDILKSTEAEFLEQETEYVEVNVDPIKMEVDMAEIVSAEELTEATVNVQHTEYTGHSWKIDYVAEILEENEHLQDGLAATQAEFQEQESEYAEVDVDPVKIEVDLDEIVSAEELTDLIKEFQLNDFTEENIDSDFLDSEKQEFKAVEIKSEHFNQETETVDCIVEAEEGTITSNTPGSLDNEVKVEYSPGIENLTSADVVGDE